MGVFNKLYYPFLNPLDFSGRAGLIEYWFYQISSLASLIGIVFFMAVTAPHGVGLEAYYNTFALPLQIAIIGLLIWYFAASLSVTVRRLHDTDRSGWWYLVSFVPFVGWLILLVLMLLPGDSGRNDYGRRREDTRRRRSSDGIPMGDATMAGMRTSRRGTRSDGDEAARAEEMRALRHARMQRD